MASQKEPQKEAVKGGCRHPYVLWSHGYYLGCRTEPLPPAREKPPEAREVLNERNSALTRC
jgi:hypothetical protein